jgi:transposase-like protein
LFDLLREQEVKTTRRHSKEFKLDLCARIDSGAISQAAACREHNLAPSMLARWLISFREKGNGAFSDSTPDPDKERRIAQLEQALGQAYLDIKILKSALEKKGGQSKL